jgi:hypothetical protein
MTLTLTGHDENGVAIPGSNVTATINYGAPTNINLTPLGQIYAMSFLASGGVFGCTNFAIDQARQINFDNFAFISKSKA